MHHSFFFLAHTPSFTISSNHSIFFLFSLSFTYLPRYLLLFLYCTLLSFFVLVTVLSLALPVFSLFACQHIPFWFICYNNWLLIGIQSLCGWKNCFVTKMIFTDRVTIDCLQLLYTHNEFRILIRCIDIICERNLSSSVYEADLVRSTRGENLMWNKNYREITRWQHLQSNFLMVIIRLRILKAGCFATMESPKPAKLCKRLLVSIFLEVSFVSLAKTDNGE